MQPQVFFAARSLRAAASPAALRASASRTTWECGHGGGLGGPAAVSLKGGYLGVFLRAKGESSACLAGGCLDDARTGQAGAQLPDKEASR